MHRVTHSPPPADFHVAATGSDVSGLFTRAHREANHHHDRPPALARVRLTLSRLPTYSHDASVWWQNWVPVATSGWGALTVIAPLLATHFFLWVSGARRAE